ncbi:MAG: NADH-quinone oxidoreductase subunit C [Aigarchaeota archaeon]|nr:NADH-quinone oxidoreductase subunit C [Candidatus Pelearchaeum maunauluense]
MAETDQLTQIVESVKQRFGDAIKEVIYEPKKAVKIVIDQQTFRDVALYLRDNHGIDHVKAITGVDLIKLPKKEEKIEVIYQLGSYSREELRRYVLNISTKLDRSSPEMDSLYDVWPSCEYHERETYEMLGVVFRGHPNLQRLLLPEFWADKPPLRKDYNVPGR